MAWLYMRWFQLSEFDSAQVVPVAEIWAAAVVAKAPDAYEHVMMFLDVMFNSRVDPTHPGPSMCMYACMCMYVRDDHTCELFGPYRNSGRPFHWEKPNHDT